MARCPIDGVELLAAPIDSFVGTVLAGRYRIESVMGDSSSSRIYRAHDLESGAAVALRMLFGEYASVRRRSLSFAREARIGRRFHDPNVLGVLDAGYTESGVPFLVTELIEARTLEGVIHSEAPFLPERVIHLALALCSGLSHIHAAGVVHRNLNGSNVLLDVRGPAEVVRITGFHLAIGPPPDDPVEAPDGVIGRPPYISPEQAMRLPVDHRTDLFSLGVLIYRMMCGAFPFEVPAKPSRRAEPRRGLEAVALILLSQWPEERFQSAAEVTRALEGL